MALRDAVRNFSRRYPDDPASCALAKHLAAARLPGRPGARVLVQGTEDPFYLGVFGVLLRALRTRGAIEAELFVHTSFNGAVGADVRTMLVRAWPLQRLLADQWMRLYAPLVERVGYRSAALRPFADEADIARAVASFRGLDDVATLERLSIDGVHVGDLVIDSYLRYRPSPRTRLDDPFLAYLVWQTYREVRRARRYFRRARPQLYLTSYTTYIQHGVAARVALQESVRVVSFGNLQAFGKTLSLEDSFHTRDARGYRAAFAAFDRQTERLEQAREQLELRLNGGVDAATFYMARSAYASSAAVVPDVRGAVVVFLHDFYDSPHVYADLVFPDFWSWAGFTIETLEAAGIPYYLKPHPNQIALSDRVLDDLKSRYPAARMLPIGVTNKQLADAGMVAAVTMYGTVAHEAAYLGVPSIACARHPHIAFEFCRTARTSDEYRRLLETARERQLLDEELRREALEFYYMHNLALDPEARRLRDRMIDCWRVCNTAPREPQAVIDAVEALAAEPGFATFADELAEELHGR